MLWEARWRGCDTCRGPEVENRRKEAESGTEGPQLSLERGWNWITVGLQVSERVWGLCQLQWGNHSNYKTAALPLYLHPPLSAHQDRQMLHHQAAHRVWVLPKL